MKKITLFHLFLCVICSLSSCRAIGDIFKAGVWVGVIVVVAIVALIIYQVTREGSNKS